MVQGHGYSVANVCWVNVFEFTQNLFKRLIKWSICMDSPDLLNKDLYYFSIEAQSIATFMAH